MTGIAATLIMMAAYFLLLYGAVGFIQDKRLFTSAPKENLAAIPDRKERFRGAHVIGWIIEVIAVLLFVSALVLAAKEGIDREYSFLRSFARYIGMLYGLEIYDILFFDWFLLCHSGFYPHFYPELKGIIDAHMFGYNKKAHILHFVCYIPICLVLAWICTLLR